jgi:hypothetical protein
MLPEKEPDTARMTHLLMCYQTTHAAEILRRSGRQADWEKRLDVDSQVRVTALSRLSEDTVRSTQCFLHANSNRGDTWRALFSGRFCRPALTIRDFAESPLKTLQES